MSGYYSKIRVNFKIKRDTLINNTNPEAGRVAICTYSIRAGLVNISNEVYCSRKLVTE